MEKRFLFTPRTYQLSLLALSIAIGSTCYRRAAHFDDAWFAEQSYWLLQTGRVRSELFRGYNGWEEQIYVFHKLFIAAGALSMRFFGTSLAASKLLTILCSCMAGGLLWQYYSRSTREKQWLAVLLYFGCGTVIRYFAVNRPEMMCMTLGLGSYLVLNRAAGPTSRPALAGFLAGLAALTHLNGLIYLSAGGILLLIRKDGRSALLFAIVGGLTTSLYVLDAVVDGKLNTLFVQFLNDPATQSNFQVSDKLSVMLNYHRIFLHSHHEVPLTVVCLICLLASRSSRPGWRRPVMVYLAALFFSFLLLSKSNFDFYYLLFVPWLVMLVTEYLPVLLDMPAKWPRRLAQLLLGAYFVVAIFVAGQEVMNNFAQPYTPDYNAQLARQMPQKHTKIIAPLSFFFGQMQNYQIQSLAYFYLLDQRSGSIPLPEFFAQAEKDNVKYIVSDGVLNASYLIPMSAPAQIGSYRRIFQDQWTSIYARNSDKPQVGRSK